MDIEDIRRIVAEFPTWHYQFDLSGVRTPIWRPKHVNRQRERERHFIQPLVETFGGSLEGKRVLDLGCNAGFWSLKAIEAGCSYVLGIDGRQMHIDQASFVFDVRGVDRNRYDFLCSDVLDFDYTLYGEFDIVLLLGLLYHVNKPFELLEKASSSNTDVLIVDTALSSVSGASFEIGYESTKIPFNSLHDRLVLCPTASAVLEIMPMFGYSVRMLKPTFDDYTGCRDYETGRRRAFVACKGPNRMHAPFVFEDS